MRRTATVGLTAGRLLQMTGRVNVLALRDSAFGIRLTALL